jgi:hypothetical protein
VSGSLYPTQEHAIVAIKRQEINRLERQGDRIYLSQYGMFPERDLHGIRIIVHLEVQVSDGMTVKKDNNATSCGIPIPAEACPTLQLLCDKAFQYYPPLYELYRRKSWEDAKQIIRWMADAKYGYISADDELYKMAFDIGVKRSRKENIDIWISALIRI